MPLVATGTRAAVVFVHAVSTHTHVDDTWLTPTIDVLQAADGFDEDEEATDATTVVPTDAAIAVGPGENGGPAYAVTVVNRAIAIYEANALTTRFDESTLEDFLPGTNTTRFDVRVLYDIHAERFIMSVLTSTSGPEAHSTLRLGYSAAASDTTNYPELANWSFQDGNRQVVVGDGVTCGATTVTGTLDQESIGYDATAWYAAGYIPNPMQNETVSALYIFPKASPDPTIRIFTNEFPGGDCIQGDALSSGAEILRAVEHFDQPEHVVELGGDPVPTPYFVSKIKSAIGTSCTTQLPHNVIRIHAVADPLDDDNRTLHVIDIAAPACFDGDVEYFLPTSASPPTILCGDIRVSNAVYREDESGEFLYIAHAVNKPITSTPPHDPEDRIVVRSYKIDMNGWPGLNSQRPSIGSSDWGEIAALGTTPGDPIHLFQPSIAVNDDGDIAIVMNRTSADSSVSIRAWGRDISASSETAVTLVKNSNTDAIPDTGFGKWGDYTDVCVAPDGTTFWGFSEYMKDEEFWGTWIFEFEIDP